MIGGATLAALGGAVFLGWFTRWDFLATALPNSPPTAFSTALGFLMAGLGFIALARGSDRWVRVTGVAVFTLGAGTLAVYLAAAIFGWPSIAFDPGEVDIAATGGFRSQMSVRSAVCFILVGAALQLLPRAILRERLLLTCAAVLIAAGGLTLVGYITGLRAPWAWWRLTGMAVPTAFGFLVVAALILGWVRRRLGAEARTAAQAFLFVALGTTTLLLLAVLTEISRADRDASEQLVRRAHDVTNAIERFISAMARTDIAARNYVLLGDEYFVGRVAVHRAAVVRSLDDLERLTADQVEQRARIAQLRLLAEQNFTAKDGQLTARRGQGIDAAVNRVRAESPAVIEGLRATTDTIMRNAERLMERRTAAEASAATQFRWMLGIGGVAVLALMVAAFLLLLRARRQLQEMNSILEQRLVDRGRDLAFLTDTMPLMVWTARPDGLAETFNRAWCEYTGLSVEGSRGGGWQGALHADDLPACLKEWSVMRAAGRSGGGEIRLRCGSDGAYRWHLWRGDAQRDAGGAVVRWVGTTADIHELKVLEADLEQRVIERTAALTAAQAQLAASHRLQRAVLDGNSFSIIATRVDGVIEIFSRGAERMLGYSADEMIGRHTPEVIHLKPELSARAEELSAQLGNPVVPGFPTLVALARQGRVDEREWTYVRKDGTRLPVRLSITALRDEGGRITGFLGIAQDLSPRRRAEAALQVSEERLAIVLRRADCLVWEAQVQLRDDDWDWHIVIQPSGLHERLFAGRPSGGSAGLWYQFEVPEQGEMNQRCRAAMLAGRSGYEQEFRLRRDGQVTWIHESVTIAPLEAGSFSLVGVATDVTALREMQTAMRESEERFRQAFEYAGIGMAIVGLDGRFLRVNASLCQIVGYDPATLLTRTFQDITHPDDLDLDLEHARNLVAGTELSYQMIKRYIHRDGRIVWVRLTGSVIRGEGAEPRYFIAQIENITVQREAEEALRQSEERLRTMVETVQDYAIFLLDAQGRIASWNSGAQRTKGYRSEEVLGRHLSLFYPPETRASADALLTAAAEKGEVEDEGWRVRKDGTRFWASVVLTALRNKEGALIGFSKVTRDITARKALEVQLMERNVALEIESRRAQESNRLKSEFLANMSHELRTPLNGIIGFSSFLAGEKPGPLNPRQKEFLADVRQSSQHLLQLINDLLDLAKIEAGRMDLTIAPFALRHMITEVISSMQPLVAEKQQELTTMVQLEDDTVWLDAKKCKQVLYNLLSNAIKYTRDGGRVGVHVRARDDGRIAMAVIDTGIGIAPEDVPRLFVEFQQLESGAARRYPGSGLGLALTRKLVDLHGGTIEVESTLGRGSTFTVIWPRVAVAVAP